jgi:hypothetical protein
VIAWGRHGWGGVWKLFVLPEYSAERVLCGCQPHEHELPLLFLNGQKHGQFRISKICAENSSVIKIRPEK